MASSGAGRVEVRILGALRVRRADGSTVDARAWRTGKTADLLRLLAIHNGNVVPVDTIIDALWPDVDETKARASLRTAASQIRRVLQLDCIVREYDGLALRSAWVDATAFTQLARGVHRLRSERSWAKVVMSAREAGALYVGELGSHGSASWLTSERQALRQLHLELLLDAAEAAVELRWLRDGVDFARRALTVDPYSERAFRAVMIAHAGLGETERALAAFQECRAVLAEYLGADPSERTQAVHLQVLTASPVLTPTISVVGRGDERTWFLETAGACVREPWAGLIAVTGEAGIGKTSFVTDAVKSLPVRVVRRSCAEMVEPVDTFLRAEGMRPPAIVILDDFEQLDSAMAVQVGHELLRLRASIVVVAILATNSHLNDGVFDGLHAAGRLHRLTLGRLTRDEVAGLASTLLAGNPGRDLVDELLTGSGGRPARAIEILRAWQADGLVVATGQGMAVMPSVDRAVAVAGRPHELGQTFEMLSANLLHVLALVAVIGGEVGAAALRHIDPDRITDDIEQVLTELEDLAILELRNGGYTFRGPWVRADMIAWLRPGERQRLHRLVAARGPVSTAERIHHWLAAGDPARAYAIAMVAPDPRTDLAALAEIRDHLLAVCPACDVPSAEPIDRIRLLDRLGDVNSGLGRLNEARDAYRAALSVARQHGVGEPEIIAAKHEDVDRLAELAPRAHTGRFHYVRELIEELEWDLSTLPSVAQERRLRDALSMADRAGDPERRVGYRLLLADSVLTPRRELREARGVAECALTLSTDAANRATSTAVLHRAGVLLGGSALAYGPLDSAWREAQQSGEADAQAQVGVLLCLATHDLGLPRFDELWNAVEALPLRSRLAAGWDWLSVRVLAERGDLKRARRYASNSPADPIRPLSGQLRALAAASLEREISGSTPEVARLLTEMLAQGRRGGCVLTSPEATALLAEVTAATDIAAAEQYLDDVERWSGEVSLGRERCLRLLALAAIRAAEGKVSTAAEVAQWAAEIAKSLGLVFVQARALSAAARYLARQNLMPSATEAAVAATTVWRAAGARPAAERGEAWLRRHGLMLTLEPVRADAIAGQLVLP